MKKNLVPILLIINSLLLLIYYLPELQSLFNSSRNSEAGAIGIIGGADGPTAIFILSKINWLPVLLIMSEIVLGAVLLFRISKK